MSRRREVAAALSLVAGVTGAIWAGRRALPPAPSLDPRASSYLDGPQGSSGVYATLDRLGVPVERWRASLLEFAASPGERPPVLVVLAPVVSLQPAEIRQVMDFVHRGGRVVAAGSGGGIASCLGWRPSRRTPAWTEADSIPVQGPRGLALPPVSAVLEPDRGDDSRAPSACADWRAVATDTLLVARDGRPVALRLRDRGAGAIILWSDADYFRNRRWRTGDAPYLLAPELVDRGARVVWDEYHQGFGAAGSLAGATRRWLTGTAWGWAVLQGAAVALVALATAAVRFGPPAPPVAGRRRSPLEHVDALAAGLEGAGGADAAVRLIIGGLGRRLRAAGRGAPPGAGWLDALESAVPSPAGRAAARRLQRLANEPGGGERVLAAAQAVEDVWDELRPRTARGKS